MDSSLVIKVKYGDTLRRFNARVDENNQLDLDMVRLRAKILTLFNFPADANFSLRYVDEDGDLVTLVDDDDLHDVMSQQLKFLRIDVHMSYSNDGKSNARSSGSSTPLRSPHVPSLFMSGNVGIADALKSVPEPLREALSKSLPEPYLEALSKSVPEPLQAALSNLSFDFVFKAASSSPVVATLADCISKMGQSILNSDCQPQVAANITLKSGVPEETVTSQGRGPQSTCLESNSNASRRVEAGNVTRGQVIGVAPVDLNNLPCDPNSSQSTNVNTAPLSSAVPDGDGKKGKSSTDDSFFGKGEGSWKSTSSTAPDYISTQTTAMGSSPFLECPFSGTCIIDPVAPSFGNHRMHPFKRSHGYTEATGGMFHKGVRCDGCGVYPITGPRFKSKVKVDYDLCSICLNKMGNETDYIRMDRPASVHTLPSFKGAYEHPRMGSPEIPHPFRPGAHLKHAKPRLDSRFVLDVNVIDGTMMAPYTAFTKIWRMRNNGTSAWPKGTHIVCIGGNKFSDSQSVDLAVPEDGVPVGKELDIAVDFRAPQLPGQYISYWMMACSSGKKFGQRVWVLIQVDASLSDSFYVSSQGLNLNIPLDASGSTGPQIIDINVQPIADDVCLQPQNSCAPTETVKQVADQLPTSELKNDFPMYETTSVGHNISPPATSVVPSSVSFPIIDLSEAAPPVPSNQQSTAVDALSSSLGFGGNNSVEETLLKELEEMGFNQVDLNKEILRMNEYNLGQSVDDLCGVSEWDPMLAELQEMGFRDNDMNKKLLVKNNGSIKRVVMDLINGEKV